MSQIILEKPTKNIIGLIAPSGFGKSEATRKLEAAGIVRIKSYYELVVEIDQENSRYIGRYPRSEVEGESVWKEGIIDPASCIDPETKKFKSDNHKALLNEEIQKGSYTPENVMWEKVSSADLEMYECVTPESLNAMLAADPLCSVEPVYGSRRVYPWGDIFEKMEQGEQFFMELAPKTVQSISKILIENNQPFELHEFTLPDAILEFQMINFRGEPVNVVADRMKDTRKHNTQLADPNSVYSQLVTQLEDLDKYKRHDIKCKIFSKSEHPNDGKPYTAGYDENNVAQIKFLKRSLTYDSQSRTMMDIVNDSELPIIEDIIRGKGEYVPSELEFKIALQGFESKNIFTTMISILRERCRLLFPNETTFERSIARR